MIADAVKLLLLLVYISVPVVHSVFFGVPGASRIESSRTRGSSHTVNDSPKFNGANLRADKHEGSTPSNRKKSFTFAKVVNQETSFDSRNQAEEKSSKTGSRFKPLPSLYEKKPSETSVNVNSRQILPDLDNNVNNAESSSFEVDPTTKPVEFTTLRPVEAQPQEIRIPLKEKVKITKLVKEKIKKEEATKTFRNAQPIQTRTKTIPKSQPLQNSQVHSRGTPVVTRGRAQPPKGQRPNSIFKGRSKVNPQTESISIQREILHKEHQRNGQKPKQQTFPREETYDYVPRGNAQIFSPSLNPLGKAEPKPKLQELEFDQSRKPLSQDFLPTCPDAKFSYIIPSPTQCDLYYVCEYGTPSKELCEDGLVFSIEEVRCVTPDLVDCKDRPNLQTPKGTGSCPRQNGIFFSDESCTEFITCRNNKPNYEKCAEGLVFDPKQRICAWADEALRPGCLPDDLLGFTCPNPKLTQEEANEKKVQLRFGDHDRFPDPEDCRFFFMCLITGQPRRAGCGNKKVFDPSTGICRPAKDVPECADYYGEEDDTSVSVSRATRLQRVQDDVSKQLHEERSNLLRLRIKRWILEAEDAEPE